MPEVKVVKKKRGRPARKDVKETTEVEASAEEIPARPKRSDPVRPVRTPIGSRDKLVVKGLPDDKVGRWVNDIDDGSRIQAFLEAGYQFVTTKGLFIGDRSVETGTRDTGSIRTMNVGQGVTAYLMAIDKDWYQEDRDRKHADIRETERSMFENDIKPEDRYGNVNINFNK